MTMKYIEYIKSKEWRIKRLEFFASNLFNKKCFICNNSPRIIEVHHKTYKRLGKELMKDLVGLCQTCHHAVHYKDDGSKRKMNHVTLDNRVFKLRKQLKFFKP